MRNLKLQMQITADGFVAGPQGQLDWMTFSKDAPLLALINHVADTSDTILLGRKMTAGFFSYWERVVANPESPKFTFAQKMVNTPKVVFSNTISHIDGKSVRVERGSLVDAVNELKGRGGKDLLVYGGATFVSSLIEHRLIDELNFFVNPVAIGQGMQVFKQKHSLKLTGSTAYACGIVVNSYSPA